MKLNKKIEDEIISAAYGDVNFISKLKVYYVILFNKNARKVFNDYKKTKKALTDIKKKENSINIKLPSYITYKKPSFWTDIYCLFTAKPFLPVMYASIIILAIFLSIFFKERVISPKFTQNYTENEIKEADKQAKYALALISSLLNETNTTIKTEILKKQVAEPLNEGLNIINNMIN